MGKLTISMAIFTSHVSRYQRVVQNGWTLPKFRLKLLKTCETWPVLSVIRVIGNIGVESYSSYDSPEIYFGTLITHKGQKLTKKN